MKKVKIFTIYILLLVLITSCEKWLYLEPDEGVIRQEFWKTKEDVHAAVMGCYASLLGNALRGSGYNFVELAFLWGEMRADLVVPYRSQADFLNIYYGDITPDNQVCRWAPLYQTINFCNTVLHFAPDVLKEDQSFTQRALNQYRAEVLAIRALMYFYLVRTFGEVPIKTTATYSDNENFMIPKSSMSEVLNQIKRDLNEAEKYAVIDYGDISNNKSRITKFTINAIQADVYLWCEQYDSCIIACNKIINSGKYGLVEGNEYWFSTLFANGNSVESIFELPFSLSILNHLYYMHYVNRYLIASAERMDELFPIDPSLPPDSADVRGDGGSYRAGMNYLIWKYVGKDRTYTKSLNEAYTHFIVYRYADILLMKAEALTQLGYIEEALEIVNLIRKRAKASKTTYPNFTGLPDKKNMTDFILEERAREFAFEGKRWFDLLRNARRNKYERHQILIDMVLKSAPPIKQMTIKNKMMDTLYHYLPIHINELNANKALKQNKFYE